MTTHLTTAALRSRRHSTARHSTARLFAALVAAWLASTSGHAAAFTWTGATNSDWATTTNWFGGTAPTSVDNVLVGTTTAATSATLDLGGGIDSLTGVVLVAPGGTPATNFGYGLEFGSAGGVSNYTVQNGTLNLAAPLTTSGYTFVKLGSGVTLNFNVNNTDSNQKMFEVRNGSTLNLGVGSMSGAGRLAFFGGSAATSTAIINVNQANYANGTIWALGTGNTATNSTTSTAQNLTLNFNANQALTQNLFAGWSTAATENTIVIRNGATVTSSATVFLGTSATSGASNARLVLGDASTVGNLNLTNTSAGSLRLGVSAVGTTASTGTLDVVNGTLTLAGASTVVLGYGTGTANQAANVKGVINVYANGTIDTARNFLLQTGASTGNGVMNFDGGILKVSSTSGATQRTNLIDSAVTVNIKNGGMKFDANNKTDTVINAALLNGGSGGLTVFSSSGASGVLTLNGTNTYIGGTMVNSGALATGATGTFGSGNITVANGAKLTLGNATSIADTASLYFGTGTTITLSSGTETVNSLSSLTGTFMDVGTWTATDLNTKFASTIFAGGGSWTVLSASAVPEPATYATLAGLGILGFAAYRRRKLS